MARQKSFAFLHDFAYNKLISLSKRWPGESHRDADGFPHPEENRDEFSPLQGRAFRIGPAGRGMAAFPFPLQLLRQKKSNGFAGPNLTRSAKREIIEKMRALNLENHPVEKILLIRLRNIGDVLLMVPTIRAFREAFPRAHIAALVNAGTQDMLTGNPLLNEVLVFDPRWKTLPYGPRIIQETKFLWKVRRRKFDVAINLTEGDRGAFLCLASGAGKKIGLFRKDSSLWWKKRVFHDFISIPDWKAHTVEQMLEFPRSLGLPVRDKRVEIFFSGDDQERISRLLEEAGVGGEYPLVQVHPTSRWLFKCWNDEHMAKVIDALEMSGKVRVVLTSGSEEKEMRKIGTILEYCQTSPINLAGKTTLKQLAALSARCRMFIGVDTAPMHIAAAVGTPVLALFGPSGEFNWGPWGKGHVVLKRDWECRPCGEDGCQGSKKSRCLEEISVEEVLGEAFRLLDMAYGVRQGGIH